MTKVALKDAKDRLARLVDDALDDHRPVTIERADGQSVVLLSASDYAGLLECAYLMSSPANATRLLAAIAEADAGRLQARDPLA